MTPEDTPRGPQAAGGGGATRFAARGGHRLSHAVRGDADSVPVLGLHDLLADRGQLRSLEAVLVGNGFRVTLPDARGHGASSAISGRAYPARELAADALAVLDAEGLSAVHVVAVGWGAGTALALVDAVPERVASLILVEPYVPSLLAKGSGGGWDAVPGACGGEGGAGIAPTGVAGGRGDAQAQLEALRGAAEAAAKGQIDRALDLYFAARMGAGWRDRLPKARYAAARRAAVNLGPLLMGAIDSPAEGRALRAITVPVTLLMREDAPSIEELTVEILAESLPHARVERVLPGAGEPAECDPVWVSQIARALLTAP